MKEQRLFCLTVRQKGALIRFEQEFRNSRVAVATPVVTYVYYSDFLPTVNAIIPPMIKRQHPRKPAPPAGMTLARIISPIT
jgi:hypothetical protein